MRMRVILVTACEIHWVTSNERGPVALSLDNCLLIFLLMDMSVNLGFVSMKFSYEDKLTQVCLFEIFSRQALWKGSEKKSKRVFLFSLKVL